MLQVQNIEKYYGSQNQVTKALDRVSFTVEDGAFIAIMGASGSGKTTLLNCISTIDTISAGDILLDGQSIAQLSPRQLAQFRRERLGFVFQDCNLLDTLTLEENIGLALSLNHADPHSVQQRARAIAEELEIGEILDKFPYQVSGGQKQRAACARAMVAGQSLLLADEPTGALDSRASSNLLELFENEPELRESASIGRLYKDLKKNPKNFDPRNYVASIMDTITLGTVPDAHVQKVVDCMKDGVTESIAPLLVQFGSYRKSHLIEVVTCEQMAERYKKAGI